MQPPLAAPLTSRRTLVTMTNLHPLSLLLLSQMEFINSIAWARRGTSSKRFWPLPVRACSPVKLNSRNLNLEFHQHAREPPLDLVSQIARRARGLPGRHLSDFTDRPNFKLGQIPVRAGRRPQEVPSMSCLYKIAPSRFPFRFQIRIHSRKPVILPISIHSPPSNAGARPSASGRKSFALSAAAAALAASDTARP